MKKLAIALSVAAGISGLGFASLSHAASDTGNAYGKIRQAVINIAADTGTELDFGEVIASGVVGATGTVVIDPVTGADTTTEGVQSGLFTPSFGGFNVTGNRPNGTYVVTLPAAPITLTCTSACLGAAPTISAFQAYSQVGGATPALSAGPAPADYLQIGATLTFDAELNDGDWAGTYLVDVVYN